MTALWRSDLYCSRTLDLYRMSAHQLMTFTCTQLRGQGSVLTTCRPHSGSMRQPFSAFASCYVARQYHYCLYQK